MSIPFIKAIRVAQRKNLTRVLESYRRLLGDLLIEATAIGDDECVGLLIQAGAPINHIKENLDGNFSVAHAYYETELDSLYSHGTCDLDENLLDIDPDDWKQCKKCDEDDGVSVIYSPETVWINEVGYYSYMHAIRQAANALVKAVFLHHNQCVQVLVDAGASFVIDVGRFVDYSHANAVQIAVLVENTKALTILQHRGLDINNKDIITSRVIIDASTQMLAFLLKAGLNVFRFPTTNTTRLAIAAGFHGSKVVPGSHIESESPKSLKHMCREVIRGHLIDTSTVNLCVRITRSKIGLPTSLCQYLLFDETPDKYM